MSWVEVLLAVLASPERARSLFTVRAAISSARLVLSPRCFALALMCSYCRSRLGLDPLGIAATSPAAIYVVRARTRPGCTGYPRCRRPCPSAAGRQQGRVMTSPAPPRPPGR